MVCFEEKNKDLENWGGRRHSRWTKVQKQRYGKGEQPIATLSKYGRNLVSENKAKNEKVQRGVKCLLFNLEVKKKIPHVCR